MNRLIVAAAALLAGCGSSDGVLERAYQHAVRSSSEGICQVDADMGNDGQVSCTWQGKDAIAMTQLTLDAEVERVLQMWSAPAVNLRKVEDSLAGALHKEFGMASRECGTRSTALVKEWAIREADVPLIAAPGETRVEWRVRSDSGGYMYCPERNGSGT